MVQYAGVHCRKGTQFLCKLVGVYHPLFLIPLEVEGIYPFGVHAQGIFGDEADLSATVPHQEQQKHAHRHLHHGKGIVQCRGTPLRSTLQGEAVPAVLHIYGQQAECQLHKEEREQTACEPKVHFAAGNLHSLEIGVERQCHQHKGEYTDGAEHQQGLGLQAEQGVAAATTQADAQAMVAPSGIGSSVEQCQVGEQSRKEQQCGEDEEHAGVEGRFPETALVAQQLAHAERYEMETFIIVVELRVGKSLQRLVQRALHLFGVLRAHEEFHSLG